VAATETGALLSVAIFMILVAARGQKVYSLVVDAND